MAPSPTQQAEEDGEDDYMNMTFGAEEPPKTVETSLQRRQRLRREGEIKGRVLSKAEQEAAARQEREEALSRSMLDEARAKKSKGFAMMAKMGFKGGALGSNSAGVATDGDGGEGGLLEPLRPEMKEDRSGIGLDSERKRKLNEAAATQQKKVKADEYEFRDRVRRERELARLERQFWAGMKVCERMDEEGGGGGSDSAKESDDDDDDDDDDDKTDEVPTKKNKRTLSTRPLVSIPVVWRGLIRKREEAERDRRMRYDLEQSSLPRLPTYVDDLEDEDDKKAMGKTVTAYVPVEDLEEEDPELEEFNALEVEERLRRLVAYLRKEHNYCFWCKCSYPDETMEGCPGLTEEDHD
ncbi:uncharacterized protein GGS25DRAFT_472227 [Hypoxylon fragiforme]|uniref:uncharacterized protein n=1 Tax=Hypoxylon fragiforme TaxID=63214 RepID=UPI0020C6F158|nr:uncharacterized protein GGS25DRAFT_472227 [Hypoxylon fragiforme]KAI2614543.1 hypothetical protein GGS25DRAFT_472227 [Hypoxylon fragiforme]